VGGKLGDDLDDWDGWNDWDVMGVRQLLLSFGGVIPTEDLNEIQNAITEHCEKVDRNEW